MPKKYVELSEDEMEYDGGFFHFTASAVVSVVGLAVTIYGATTGNKTAKAVGNALTIIGIASTGLGAIGAVATITSNAATTAATTAAGTKLAGYATIGVIDPLVNLTISGAGK